MPTYLGDSAPSSDIDSETDGEGVNGDLTWAENSISEFSRARGKRIDKVRQLIAETKQQDKTTRNGHNVETTISEDLADGHIAKLEASLKLLVDDDLQLFLPSDELEDDEIHVIEQREALIQSGFSLQEGGSALADYQTQLMLLEQQNKKRLMIARQEQAQVQTQARAEAAKRGIAKTQPFIDIPSLSKTIAQVVTTSIAGKRHSKIPSELQPLSNLTHSMMRMHPPPLPSKRQKYNHDRDAYNHMSNGKDSSFTGEGKLKEVQVASGQELPPHFDLLYRVRCSHEESGRHPVPAFRDVPGLRSPNTPTNEQESMTSKRLHFNGTVPVYDVQKFMEDETDDIAFVAMRTIECSQASVMMYQSNGSLRWTEAIYMKSKTAKNTLREVAMCYFQPDVVDMEHDEVGQFEYDRIHPADLFLFHHRHALQDYIQTHPQSSPYIKSLLQYMRGRYGEEFAAVENLFERGLVSQKYMQYLFQPNDLVVSGSHGKPAAFVLQDWPILGKDGWVTLSCWSFQTNGSIFVRKRIVLSIIPLETPTIKIQDLVAYPLKFASQDLKDEILKRGKKQWELRNATQVTYKGWNVARDQFFPDARFMIDHKMYHKMHENAKAFRFEKPYTTHPFDKMPASITVEEEPSDVHLQLMSPDVHGFYLNEKKWIQLFVENVEPVTWNKKAFERLVLPPQTKDLVRALITVRKSQRGIKQGLGVAGKRTDITSGKGNGLIVLLHGGPGTGKTLTGESVAEIAEMPLYRVTCGDIGTNAEAVEKYLNTVLYLGKAWNCVLLLDEADVFLEERSMADLKRNSLVSVFLRILEYYDGILILTSNRVGMFDEAFKSRIQVSLHYENLNRSTRKRIWQNFLEMLEEDEEDVNFDEIKLHLDELAGNELNGRQIRNVLTTARQLAIFKNQRLDWDHLDHALSVSSDFNKYLKSMQGHTDDQRARDAGYR